MKKILYLFVVAVLLAACSSNNGIRTYNNGKTYVTIIYQNPYNKTVIDTISIKDYNKELKVLVKNDTAWFHSNLFLEDYSEYDLTFVYKNPKQSNTLLRAKQYSIKEYYVILSLGRFFNIDDIKEIYFIGFSVNYDQSVGSLNVIESKYYLDLGQFKHINK